MRRILWVISICICTLSFAGEKDTIYAFVSSGKQSRIELSSYQLERFRLDFTIDSLQKLDNPPNQIIQDLKWFKTQKINSKNDIVNLIDSLMSLDSIPYNLLNYVNLHINKYKKEYDSKDFHVKRVNQFYNSWNTEMPWDLSVNYVDSLENTLPLSEIGNGDFEFHYPVQQKPKEKFYYHGTLTSKYGWRDGARHNGVDLDLHVWDSVYTVYSGTVRLARNYGGYGRVVVVRHDNGLETLYGHLHRIKVKPGDRVEGGQVVGLGGSSGKSTGSHLHFEVRLKNIPINPEHLIDFKNRVGRGSDFILKKSQNGLVAIENGCSSHTVQRGDSPWKIANRYGMELTEFRDLNGFTKRTRLSVGQVVKIRY
ncbi:MAG: peptidoglycan DD-metalloendopeptidase family protein [Crocinitomicaceae bacterium]